MKSKSIRWQLSLSYAGIALLAALLLGMILLGILARYFAVQESTYLIENAREIGAKVFISLGDDLYDERITGYMEKFSFYINAQIRLLDEEGKVLADSGLPQSIIDIRVEDGSDKEVFAYPKDFTIGRARNSLFSSWLFSIQEEVLNIKPEDDVGADWRSQQVITQAYYNEEGQLLGYVELSNGPAYGRDILRSVTWGWAIAAFTAVLLAAIAGLWVSRRFSTPLENLTRITTQMAGGNLSVRAGIECQDEFGLLANSFNQMADTIEAKVAALRRFVADAAHELHSPLTALRSNLELSEKEKALKQVERMDDLTRRLLDLSKIEADTGRHFEEVDVKALLLGLAEPYASQAEQKEINFNLEIGCDSAKVKGDADQLITLTRNLLDNAIKFTPAGGQVNVMLTAQDEIVKLSVLDTGIGIPEEDFAHLFSRFHRGRNASAYPGSGLGLAIVKAIADRHGAKISVDRGTTGTQFTVFF